MKDLWVRIVYIDDVQVSFLSSNQHQRGHTFQIAIECATGLYPGGACDAVPAHTWQDIEIIPSKPNLDFRHVGPWNHNTAGGEMDTADGGKTWTFAPLHAPKQKPYVDDPIAGNRCYEHGRA